MPALPQDIGSMILNPKPKKAVAFAKNVCAGQSCDDGPRPRIATVCFQQFLRFFIDQTLGSGQIFFEFQLDWGGVATANDISLLSEGGRSMNYRNR
jgi:hypothetical protein